MATYYVDPIEGDDTFTGLGPIYLYNPPTVTDRPFKTLKKAIDTATVSGDIIKCRTVSSSQYFSQLYLD